MHIQPAPLTEVWALRHKAMYPNHPLEVVKLPDDHNATHWGIYEQGKLVSVISVFQNGQDMQFRKLATDINYRRKGFAKALLQHVQQLALQNNVQKLWCNARLNATGLYEKIGMRPTGNSWQSLGQDFIIMEKQINPPKMEIIPAIDIIDGKCVRLSKGDYAHKTIYNEQPLEVALAFEDAGLKRLHLVDLDGAKAGEVKNWKVLEQVAAKTNLTIDFSGGISSNQSLSITFNSGAAYAAIGSVAVKNEALLNSWFTAYGVNKFILGADVLQEKIQIKGWTEATNITILDFIKSYQSKGVKQFFCTDISKDGLLQGSATDLYKKILNHIPNIHLIASGGVSNLQDLNELKNIGCSGVIIGKAIYENRISLKDLTTFNHNN